MKQLMKNLANCERLIPKNLMIANSQWNSTSSLDTIIQEVAKLGDHVKQAQINYKLQLVFFKNVSWIIEQHESTLGVIEDSVLNHESVYKIHNTIRDFQQNAEIAK